MRSIGSGLDDIGWEPRSESIRIKHRLEKTIDQVRAEFEKVLNELASESRFGGHKVLSTELEMLEEATALVRKALRKRT